MNPTCERVARLFLADCRVRLRPRTVKSYGEILRRWCAMHGSKALCDVGSAEIAEYVTAQRRRKRVDGGINVDLACIRAYLGWALEEEHLEKLPRLKLLRTGRRIEREPLSPVDVQKLLAAAKNHRDRVLVALLASTGIRIDEALWLQWRDVDLADGSVRVRAKKGFKPKSHHERAVYLSPGAIEFLKAYQGTLLAPEPGSWVFRQRRGDGRQRLTRAAEIGRELFKRAKLYRTGDVWHELRRAAATGWLDQGVDLDTVRRLLGHADIATTQRYLRPREHAMRAAAQRGLL